MALHDWLPSFQHLQKMRGIKDPRQHQCRHCRSGVENIFHIILECVSSEAAKDLLSWVRKLALNTTIFDIIYLQVQLKQRSKEELAVMILTTLSVHYIWLNREKGGLKAWELRAEIVGHNTALLKTKFSASAEVLHSLIL